MNIPKLTINKIYNKNNLNNTNKVVHFKAPQRYCFIDKTKHQQISADDANVSKAPERKSSAIKVDVTFLLL